MTNIEQLNRRILDIKKRRETLQSEYAKNKKIISSKKSELKKVENSITKMNTAIATLTAITARTPEQNRRLTDYGSAKALATTKETTLNAEIAAIETAQTARATEINNLKSEKEHEQQLRNVQEDSTVEKKASWLGRGVRAFRESVTTNRQAPTIAAAVAIALAGGYYASQNMPEINNPFNGGGKSKPRTEQETPKPEKPQEREEINDEESTTADYTDGLEEPKEKQKRVGRNVDENVQENFEEAPLGALFQKGKVFSVDEDGNTRNYTSALSELDKVQIEASMRLKTGLCIRKVILDNGETNYKITNLDGTPFYTEPGESPFIN